MFLNRLIARAAGTAPVLKNAPPLAQELADPTWGPVPKPEVTGPEVTGPEVTEPEVAALLPTHRPQAPRPRAPKTASAAPLAFPPSTPALPQNPPKTLQAGALPVIAKPRLAPVDRPAVPLAAPKPRPVPPVLQEFDPAPATIPQSQVPPKVSVPPDPSKQPRSLPVVTARPMQSGPGPTAPEPAARAPDLPDQLEVHIDIGRLDLVSPQQPRTRPAPPKRAGRPGPSLTLEAYLDQRRGDRR